MLPVARYLASIQTRAHAQETWVRLKQQVGRRGYSLLALGIFDELYALSIPSAETVHTATSRWLASVLPLTVWAVLWAAVGGVVIVGAFMRSDRWAFAAAALLKIMWGTLYGIGWIFHDVYRSWVSAALWLMFASWVLLISTWPEQEWVSRSKREMR